MSTADSESADKRIWHKRARAMWRGRLAHDPDPLPVLDNEACNPWDMLKDGKVWLRPWWNETKLRRK
jgi:hypothetical protein